MPATRHGRLAPLVAALAALAAIPAAAPAATLSERTIAGGRVVHDGAALDRRALELAPGTAALVTIPAGAARVRARTVGCASATLGVRSRRGSAMLTIGRRYAQHALPGVRRASARLLARDNRGACRIRIDEIRIRIRGEAPPSHQRSVLPRGRRVPLGTSVQLEQVQSAPALVETLLGTFSSITPENELKMERTQPRRGHYTFAEADALVAFANEHDLGVRGHALVYGSQTSPWVADMLFPQEVEQVLRDHVRTIVSRYKGTIREWDVVNEAFDESGRYRHNGFYDKLGPSYVEIAYEAAHAADPTAKLYYNELDAEAPGAKRDAVVKLATRLRSRGLLHGVGLQTHTGIGVAPSRAQFVETFRIYERLGLDVQVTEMDVAARGDGSPTWLDLRLAHQADVYRDVASACFAVAACQRLTVWGVSDRFSWLGADNIPLLFDENFQAKPALAAVRDGLAGL